MSLRAVIEGAGLTLSTCARALSVDPHIFAEWADSKREIPPSYAEILSVILGVEPARLTDRSATTRRAEPSAIWFKFRGKEFKEADRESILLIRRLGHNLNQFERAVEGQTNRTWELLFQQVLKDHNPQDSPQSQGRAAAKVFRGLTQFGSGGTGSSEYLRGNLRSKGILVIESPIPKSHMEGCSFLVGESTAQRPCLFVNSFGSTWFRRNMVIMHELGHAIFDPSTGAEVDSISSQVEQRNERDSLSEIRAESFARECLLPKSLILTFCQKFGVKVTHFTPEALADLVAFSGVEQKTVIDLLQEYDLIDYSLAARYEAFEIWDLLKAITDHALSTSEYVDKIGADATRLWSNKRFTSIGQRNLLLPISYVQSVLDAVKALRVSISRAVELLMIDRETFDTRFAYALSEVTE